VRGFEVQSKFEPCIWKEFSMKTAGIIGGIGPESTIEYYRLIISSYREQKQDGSYPSIVINSIDLKKMLDLITANQLAEVTEYLLVEVQRVVKAGADFAVVAANSPHIVFDALRRRSPVPLISIVEVTCQAAKAKELKRVGLFGPRFVMRGRFYPEVFVPAGISLVTPTEEEQAYIHDKYFGELVNGIILTETRENLLAIVERLKRDEGIEGLILGGTELSLILGEVKEAGILFLDTTKLHVAQIVAQLLA
jgi:aspartate racemase